MQVFDANLISRHYSKEIIMISVSTWLQPIDAEDITFMVLIISYKKTAIVNNILNLNPPTIR